ncbi:hypothetical protein Ahy_A05g021997 [Arachis hypogaea]|uniref:Transcription factor n=1 Tax=Arachis hypogaea TaxID=3818 RepID=A0A445CZ46_ARAHY|nr:hypothetical protein Ahy_A05g021997 [Arachis hypogaea]
MGCQQIEKTKAKHRKGLWSPEEDNKLRNYILNYGHGCWSSVPIKAGLQRNGKSCRLRWINYLRPGLKRGMFTKQEEDTIVTFHHMLGNKWSQIAQKLPGRTDNEIKNYWHSYLKKKVAKEKEIDESHQQVQYATSSSETIDYSFSPNKLVTNDPNYGLLLQNMDKPAPNLVDHSYEHNHNNITNNNYQLSKEASHGSLPKLLFAEWLSLDQVNGGSSMNSDESLMILGNGFDQNSTFQEDLMHMSSSEGPFGGEYQNSLSQCSATEVYNSEVNKFSNQVVGNDYIQHFIDDDADLCSNFSLNNGAMYMGKTPCCDKHGVRRGAWTPEEDEALIEYIKKHGHGSWRTVPKQAGLLRCGKSCRLRWINYLRPDIKRGPFTTEEEGTIIQLHGMLGNRWAAIASHLPGRTDNEIKNFWNTQLKKRLPRSSFVPDHNNVKSESPSTRHMVQWESARVEAEARLSMESSLHNSFSASESYQDHFLQLWHSEVGQSFRVIKAKEEGAVVTQNLVSQASLSSSKLESSSEVSLKLKNTESSFFADITHEQQKSSSKAKLEDGGTAESSLGYYEFLDTSDSSINHLLDVPDGEVLFLGQNDNFLNTLDGRCE